MEDLIRVLEKTVSSIQTDQNEAVTFIQEFIHKDFAGFLKALSDVLYNQQNPPVVRTAAGLQLKNQLTARDDNTRHNYQERWRSLPPETRQYIKERVFSTLGTEVYRPSSAPQCVAYIAITELPLGLWPGYIQALATNVTTPTSTAELRLASLEAIGYTCQEIDHTCLEPNDSDNILSAIVCVGMRTEEIDEVKLAATNALLNSLEFCEANFVKHDQRDLIMHAVCTATQCSNALITVAALQCLVKIMTLYYHYMDRYMSSALFAITTLAMRSENDEIALQGIEFWSNVCDEEIQLANDLEEAREMGTEEPPQDKRSKNFARQALHTLVPILVEMLTRQDENDDTEDWKPCKSAHVCLVLLANCCGKEIIGHVLPFITQNVNSDDWRRRDAAVNTFGAILDGPDQQTLQPIAIQIVPFLIRFMRDQSLTVRDSSAWAIGKLCDTVPEAVINLNEILHPLILALIENLDNEPRVATNVCWAINSLVTAAGIASRDHLPPEARPDSFILSQYYAMLLQGLLRTTERQDSPRDSEQNPRSSAFEALMAVVKMAPNDCYQYVYPTTFEYILQRITTLNQTIQKPEMRAPEIRTQLYDFISFSWAALGTCFKRMDKEHTVKDSDRIMENLLITLACCMDSCGVQEDAIMAASNLLDVVGLYFSRYMDVFKPYLLNGISAAGMPQLNCSAIGLLSDLARILTQELFPHCADFMQVLITKLKDEAYDKSAKAQILSVFGDFALAFGKKFEPWIVACLDMLHLAGQYRVDREDYDSIDYSIKLRECTIEGYAGIVQGLNDRSNPQNHQELTFMQPRIPLMFQFLESLVDDPDMTDSLLRAACGLVGDIVDCFGIAVSSLVGTAKMRELVTKGRRSRQEKTKTIANWTHNVIGRLNNAPAAN